MMQDFEIIIPIKEVEKMHTEFFWWKRYMKNDNPSVSIEKRYPQLWAFMNICNITLQITPKHEGYKFIFSHPEATQLIVDLKYMVDTPPTLLAFCEKLQVRVNNKVTIPCYVCK